MPRRRHVSRKQFHVRPGEVRGRPADRGLRTFFAGRFPGLGGVNSAMRGLPSSGDGACSVCKRSSDKEVSMNEIVVPGAPYPFSGVMAFAWIGIFLLVGMVLRALFPPFRRYLIPACIIGGLVGLAAQTCGLLALSGFAVDNHTLQLVVFHLFNLTWIFLGLKMPRKEIAGQTPAGGSNVRMVLWISVLNLGVLGLANFMGVGGTTLLREAGVNQGPASLGALTAAGFIGGPGQTLTIAGVWAQASSHMGLGDFALAASSSGFVAAIVVGIPLMNLIARKRRIQLLTRPSTSEECGFYDECEETVSAGNVTTVPNNIDVLAYHIAMGLFTYALTFMLSAGLALLLPGALLPILWGLFFILCCLMGIIVRKVMVLLRKGHLCCNSVNARITNSLVDFLVCGTFISIQVGAVGQYWQSYLLSIVLVTAAVAVCIWRVCGQLEHNGPEYFAFLFGAWTGTISTGMVLLRMIDPENQSVVPVQFGLANTLIMPGITAFTLVVYLEVTYGRSPLLMLACYGLVMFVCLAALRFIPVARNRTGWNVPSGPEAAVGA